MDKREILQRIIDDGGDCEALHHRTQLYLCKICPMSKLKQRPDGTYLSCWESMLVNEDGVMEYQDGTMEEAYLKKAIELIQDLEIEDMLKGDNIAKNP